MLRLGWRGHRVLGAGGKQAHCQDIALSQVPMLSTRTADGWAEHYHVRLRKQKTRQQSAIPEQFNTPNACGACQALSDKWSRIQLA